MMDLWGQKKNRPGIVGFTIILISSLFMHIDHPVLAPISYNVGIFTLTATLAGIMYLYRSDIKNVCFTYRRTLLLTSLLYLWMWLGVFFTEYPFTVIKFSLKYTVYFFIFWGLLLLFGEQRRTKFIPASYQILLMFLALLASFGIIEHFHPSFFVFDWVRPGSPVAGQRVMSLMQYPNPLGALMAYGVILSLSLKQKSYLSLWSSILLILVFLVVLILSDSRNGILALTVSLGLCIYPYKLVSFRQALSTVIILSAAVAIALMSSSGFHRVFQTLLDIPQNIELVFQYLRDSEVTLQDMPPRFQIWNIALYEWTKKPLTGVGIQTFAENIIAEHYSGEVLTSGLTAHNLLLAILLELGIPGLLVSLGCFASILSSAKIQDSLIGLSTSFIFTSQIVDYFIHDLTMVTIMLFFMATAAASKLEDESIIEIQ